MQKIYFIACKGSNLPHTKTQPKAQRPRCTSSSANSQHLTEYKGHSTCKDNVQLTLKLPHAMATISLQLEWLQQGDMGVSNWFGAWSTEAMDVTTCTHDQMITCTHDLMITCTHGQMITCTHGQMTIWAHGQMIAYAHGKMITCTHHWMIPCTHGQIMTCTHGQMIACTHMARWSSMCTWCP